MAGATDRDGPAALLRQLEAGEEPPESVLVRTLRSASCPRELVTRLAQCRWARNLRQVPALLARQPGCPRAFAWDVIPRLGWHDLLDVVRDPRTSPAVRHFGERKLSERLKHLTIGERTALARLATRSVIADMLADEAPACVEALLANPRFTEADAVRLINVNQKSECVIAVLRHPRWGVTAAVVGAAVRCARLPLGVALGLVASLPARKLEDLAGSRDAPATIREQAHRLLERRRATAGDTRMGSDEGRSG